MQRAITYLLLFVFSVWILPLGAFIKPSQEKIACGGQRAICLCHIKVVKSKTSGQPIYQGAGEHKEEAGTSSGGNNYYVLSQQPDQSANQFHVDSPNQSFLYSLLLSRPIDHVPKV